MSDEIPIYAELLAAAGRLSGVARITPLLESADLNRHVGGRVLVKAETLQFAGSFKFRGAYNRLSQLDHAQKRRGVVAYSSGNHALAVATAAATLGTSALLVMPRDAPELKVARVRALGGSICFYERERGDREAIAERLAHEHGRILVPPSDDRDVIAGQATVAMEIFEQARDRGLEIDVMLACCSGGGLVAGCALAMAERKPDCQVYAVESAEVDRMRRSLAYGAPVRLKDSGKSLCDALTAAAPGRLPWAICRHRLAGVLAVNDIEVCKGMAAAFRDLKLVVEPSGAAALGAALARQLDLRGKTIAVICSGANVDHSTYLAGLVQGSRVYPDANAMPQV
jgi:threonine dehydratase